MQKVFPIFFVVGLFATGILALFLVSFRAITAPEMTGGTFGSNLKLYANLDLGFSLRYPADFLVNASYAYEGLGDEKQISGVAFSVPKKKTEGTNLSPDSKVSVEVIPNTPHCSARMFIRDPRSVKPLLEKGESYSFASVKEAGAGNFYEEQVYAFPAASPCIAVRYFIHSTNVANYPSGTVTEFNRADLLSAFDSVRYSLAAKAK
jgi:hypothetical protein